MLHAEQHRLISSLYSAHFLLNVSVWFIDVCKIVISTAVCAWLIPTWVGIGMRHLTRPSCVCFSSRSCTRGWLRRAWWRVFLDMLRVVYALREDLVSVASSFQPKLELRCVWWLYCRVYSLREGVTTSLEGGMASNSKRRRRAMVKEGGEQR